MTRINGGQLNNKTNSVRSGSTEKDGQEGQ